MKKLLFAALVALALGGCIRQDAIKFHHVEDMNISLGSTVAVDAVMLVENTSGKKIQVSDALFFITDRDGNEIATLMMNQMLELPRKSTVSLNVPVRIRLTNPLAGLALLKDMDSQAPWLRVSGSAMLKAGGIKKKYKIENMPLSSFISIFEDNVKIPDNLQNI